MHAYALFCDFVIVILLWLKWMDHVFFLCEKSNSLCPPLPKYIIYLNYTLVLTQRLSPHNVRSMDHWLIQRIWSLQCSIPWWRHQMEIFAALLARSAGNSPVIGEFPHRGQWRGALMLYLIWDGINGWVNNGEAGDLRRHRTHYDVTVIALHSLPPAIAYPSLIYHLTKCFILSH